MFRGKESSNSIELSRLVQDLLNFGVLGSLWLCGWGVVGGCPHTCAHAHACTHMHACTHAHGKHDNFMQMAPWGNPWEFPMMSYVHACVCVCVCAHACACVWGHPLTTPTHINPPPTPQGDP